jgi:hypothetical protein
MQRFQQFQHVGGKNNKGEDQGSGMAGIEKVFFVSPGS